MLPETKKHRAGINASKRVPPHGKVGKSAKFSGGQFLLSSEVVLGEGREGEGDNLLPIVFLGGKIVKN
jgi:hypothetical protein